MILKHKKVFFSRLMQVCVGLKEPKCEIFNLFDFYDFYVIKSL